MPSDFVGLLITFVSAATTAETIEMPFEMLTQVNPRNHGSRSPKEKGLCGEGAMLFFKPIEKHEESRFIASMSHPWTAFNDL